MSHESDEIRKALLHAAPFRDAFHYNPGHSDLDNEQPITITVTLGDWRRLNYILNGFGIYPKDA